MGSRRENRFVRVVALLTILATGCLESRPVGSEAAAGGKDGLAEADGNAQGGTWSPDAAEDTGSTSPACPNLQYLGSLGTVSVRSGACDVGIRSSSMFGFGLYADCHVVPASQLIELPEQSGALGSVVLYTVIGDSCAYLESHPSARLDVVYLPGPHGGP